MPTLKLNLSQDEFEGLDWTNYVCPRCGAQLRFLQFVKNISYFVCSDCHMVCHVSTSYGMPLAHFTNTFVEVTPNGQSA